ncbi:hypothetical protein BDV96DRAFT_501453 [Lophiotrema nucula]|uniref:EF hand domain-containing protein n=1 Tax=Lophiotrema nucula TaxID=690887 RepID=A0A6A5YVN7_9PLEO|nr:hypothetical protein BDV96DRAFT_501453 [Lophiotrema nucula]
MKSSTPSSVSRYRPAILAVVSIAALYGVYLLYNSSPASEPAATGLHRRNAVRRPNVRTRQARPVRLVQRLQQNATPLGEFDFFGNPIVLDPRRLVTAAELREIAHQSQPGASPELVDSVIAQLYDTFLDRLVALTFPSTVLSAAEREAVVNWLGPLVPSPDAVIAALQRHGDRFSGPNLDDLINSDGAESVALTDISYSDVDDSSDNLAADDQVLQRTLYHIAEDRARHEGVIHRGITCNGCDTKPIRGIRWRCANCADFDLCSDCEATDSHYKTHIFYKIRVPAPYLGIPKQEPVYPGHPHVMSPSLSSPLRKRLVSETKVELEELEALWDQFTCLASTEWESDPNHIGWAVDRRAFNQAFVPRYSSFISAPNLIYDRVFAYYDTDRNGMIGFEEFVKGLDGMHSTDTKTKWKIVFNGYDVDGDGYISRKDVLRMFRALYAIEKEATRNYLAEASEELSVRGAFDTIHSSQPLGSAFTQNGIPSNHFDRERAHVRQGKVSEDQENLPPPIRQDEEDVDERRGTLGLPQMSYRPITLGQRWQRRQYYIDEEEGFTRPHDAPDDVPEWASTEQTDGGADDVPPIEPTRPRGSRSSSRVRFEDDVDLETRSNASTSSRPFGERWGGYEIPEPEKDLGKEVLYQITQQSFNELLNPMFLEKEDNAMDAFKTRLERRKLASQIDQVIAEFTNEKEVIINKAVLHLGFYRYAKVLFNILLNLSDALKIFFVDLQNNKLGEADAEDRLSRIISAAESELTQNLSLTAEWPSKMLDLWNAKLCRMQFRHELTTAILCQAVRLEWLPNPAPLDNTTNNGFELLRDPTMPQFRPNSSADRLPSSTLESEETDSEAESGAPILDGLRWDYTFHGQFFIVEAMGVEIEGSTTDDDASTHASPSSTTPDHLQPPLDSRAAQEPIALPVSNASTTDPKPVRPPPLDDTNNDPTIFYLFVHVGSMLVFVEPRRADEFTEREMDVTYKPLEHNVRQEALEDPNSPLHITLLASLVDVEREISERKGSGLLNYEEFEAVMKGGCLRFLEAWLDWVSF